MLELRRVGGGGEERANDTRKGHLVDLDHLKNSYIYPVGYFFRIIVSQFCLTFNYVKQLGVGNKSSFVFNTDFYLHKSSA